MNAVWYRFRATFRRRAASYIGVALLLGLFGGVALASLAGARRTASAFPRFRRATNPSDIQVDAGPYDPEAVDAIGHLPQVARAATYVAFYAVPLHPDGQPDDSYFQDLEAVGSLDGLYLDQDRFTPTSGRLPRSSREDEVVVNANLARVHHIRVGQRFESGWNGRLRSASTWIIHHAERAEPTYGRSQPCPFSTPKRSTSASTFTRIRSRWGS